MQTSIHVCCSDSNFVSVTRYHSKHTQLIIQFQIRLILSSLCIPEIRCLSTVEPQAGGGIKAQLVAWLAFLVGRKQTSSYDVD